MAFNVRAGSPDMLGPVHVFPGDEHTVPETYRRVIFSGYISTVATVLGGAQGYGLTIDPVTFERWKRIGAAAGLLDTFLDESADPDQASALYDQGLSLAFDDRSDPRPPDWVDGRLEPAVRLLRNSVRSLPAHLIEALLDSSKFIGRAVLGKARCTHVRDYVRLLKLEAFHSSRLIHGSASDDVREQAGFSEFQRWCTNSLQLATLLDSTWDLWADNRSGQTGVPASMLNSARIAIHGYRPYRALTRPRRNRRATLSAIVSRCRFSLLPTTIAMRHHTPRVGSPAAGR